MDFWLPLIVRGLSPCALALFASKWPLRILSTQQYRQYLAPLGPAAAAFSVSLGTLILVCIRGPNALERGAVGLVGAVIFFASGVLWLETSVQIGNALQASFTGSPPTNHANRLLRRLARQATRLWLYLYGGATFLAVFEQIFFTYARSI